MGVVITLPKKAYQKTVFQPRESAVKNRN